MNTQEYIESGTLELYVYGILNESETKEISELAKTDIEIQNEIIAIEKAIVNLSSSFSPQISAEVYEKIKAKLDLKYGRVIAMKPESKKQQYLGWAASFVLLITAGYFFQQLNGTNSALKAVKEEKSNLQKTVVDLEFRNKETSTALNVVRDSKNTVVTLGGQAVSPQSFARIYWNKETQSVYVDASGLPEPPEGKVYQIWSLKLSPVLTPTSIGLLDNFQSNTQKIFAVSGTSGAEAFGITLEPAGGSASPTMEQLYTLGKV